jgi:hypothetical protein
MSFWRSHIALIFFQIFYVSGLWSAHILGWISLPISFSVLHGEQSFLEGSMSSTTERGENELPLQQLYLLYNFPLFVYQELLLGRKNFAVCELDRFPLAPQAPQFVIPGETIIRLGVSPDAPDKGGSKLCTAFDASHKF